MPTTISRTIGGLAALASALIGDYQPQHVKVDVSALDTSKVDARGYLKPNVVFTLNGLAPTTATAVAQVETATVSGTITEPGNVSVIVTSELLPGGTKTFAVAVADEDTAALVAGKIRAALTADADIAAVFAVSGATTAVILTALVAGPNDATLNIATATGTATGLTAVPTSANTTAGVAGSASEVPAVTIEPTKIAASNSTEDLTAASDVFVACAVSGVLNRDIMEDTLGRVLTPAEIAILRGPNSNLTLSLT